MHPLVDMMVDMVGTASPPCDISGKRKGRTIQNPWYLVQYFIFLCLTQLHHYTITPSIALQGHQTDIKNKTETMYYITIHDMVVIIYCYIGYKEKAITW